MNTQSNIRAKSQDTASEIREKAEDLKNDARAVAEEAGTNVRKFFHDKSKQAEKLREETENAVKDHPLKAIGYAALAGFALSMLVRR